ncbi:hypothetical protein EXU48_15660 [Occultella glacieicola]|uniref:Uncharacterized protein n=1 Tax=Occultella glacieicola TaxID=2518684 RepID=A0ABY2E0X7_9MICO|nr:hypothetical protein [Occultella glacieicola]TDE91581.1 hypothetical protein EXU48_15660 [Occultella glacieicola]
MDDITRDHLGRMVCDHETPGGAPKCPLCRRIVLDLHAPSDAKVKAWRRRNRAGTPMPDWFKQQLTQMTEPKPEHPDLLDGGAW